MTDQDGMSVLAPASVSVGDVYSGVSSALSVGEFAGSPPAGASAVIYWGDGSSSPGTIVPGAGNYTVTGTHTYPVEGQYAVTVSVTGGGATVSANRSVRVVRSAVTAYSAPIVAGLDGEFNNALLGAFADLNLGHTAADYQAVAEWGDGTTSAATVSGGNGYFGVTGSHAFLQEVVKPVAVRLLWRGQALLAVMAQDKQPAPKRVARPSFMAALEKNFKTWAGDDKKLTRLEVDKLLDDPTIKGADAAALAVLKAYVMDLGGEKRNQLSANVNLFVADTKDWTPDKGLTADHLKYYKKLQSESSEPLYVEATELEKKFDEARARIAGTSKVLLPPVKKGEIENPNFDTVQQGMIGDCAFLAALDARVNYFRSAFRERFKVTRSTIQDVPTKYEVTFGNYKENKNVKKITVTEPTDAQIALYATAGKGGLWLTVMEKAYVKLVNDDAKLTPLGRLNASAYEALADGQPLEVPIKIFGGATATRYAIRDVQKAKLQKMIIDAVAAKNTVTVDTPKLNRTFRPAFDLPGLHAYTVLAIDKDGKNIMLRNPWGDKSGTIRYGGVFTLSFDEFYAQFRYVAIEEFKK